MSRRADAIYVLVRLASAADYPHALILGLLARAWVAPTQACAHLLKEQGREARPLSTRDIQPPFGCSTSYRGLRCTAISQPGQLENLGRADNMLTIDARPSTIWYRFSSSVGAGDAIDFKI